MTPSTFDKPLSQKFEALPVGYHQSIAHVLKFFAYSHLPSHLQDVSREFALLAFKIADRNPDEPNPEVTLALRKLLESKDAAVRAAL